MSTAGLLNAAWMWKCTPELARFHRATRAVAKTQERVLLDILSHNCATEFGRQHRFDRIGSARDYERAVPIGGYEPFGGRIARIGRGERNVLFSDSIERLEPTSGSTGAEKLIPYTAGLRRQFQRGVAAWIADLFHHHPAARRGRAYWSISPTLGPPRRSPAGIAIGFAEDAEYLGRFERAALARLLVVPGSVARLTTLETFRYVTLLLLLQAADLALVSVWNPTFLTALLAGCENWADRLCHDLRRGTVSPPGSVAVQDATRWAGWIRPNAARSQLVRSVFLSGRPTSDALAVIWPRLALISCWADAAAARGVEDVRRLFPHVAIQPKGLLATEGIVSFPLVDRPAPALAIRSHFYEFLEGDADEAAPVRARLAHELARGGRYRVVITTAGGLYRYALNDEVEVVGHLHHCPLLRFLGKSDRTSDLVGEKLGEPFVRGVVERSLAVLAIPAAFSLIVPVIDRPPRYRLYVQPRRGAEIGDEAAVGIAAQVEGGLSENPYYRHAVGIGQLAPLEVRWLDPAGEPAYVAYERGCVARGQKPGDIKPTALDAQLGWEDVFLPLEVDGPLARRETTVDITTARRPTPAPRLSPRPICSADE
ncbi:MAG: GH3 auxin-responsive promoter family protein [Planctomycetia bacterium]|nr:GH3 auxin-responsive promoter family protein [Planctomycetia bacterium]